MTVKPDSPHQATHEGVDYRFCSAGCRTKFVADPAKYLAPAAVQQEASVPGRHAVHLPDASGDPAGRSRELPDLRHGARAGDACARRWREPGAHGLPSPVLVDAAVVVARARARDVRASHDAAFDERADMAGTDPHGSRGALGRLALLPALGAVDRQSQPQHVDADRHGCGSRVRVQRGRDDRAGPVPGLVPASTVASPSTSRRRRSSSR